MLAVENEEYDKVEVGGVTGYMASRIPDPAGGDATARYGEDSGFGDGRAAEIDLNGHVDDERDPPRNDGRHERGAGDA